VLVFADRGRHTKVLPSDEHLKQHDVDTFHSAMSEG
jgi:hypothetical protein